MAVNYGKRAFAWYLNGIAADLDAYNGLNACSGSEAFPRLFFNSVDSEAKRR